MSLNSENHGLIKTNQERSSKPKGAMCVNMETTYAKSSGLLLPSNNTAAATASSPHAIKREIQLPNQSPHQLHNHPHAINQALMRNLNDGHSPKPRLIDVLQSQEMRVFSRPEASSGDREWRRDIGVRGEGLVIADRGGEEGEYGGYLMGFVICAVAGIGEGCQPGGGVWVEMGRCEGFRGIGDDC